MLEKSFELIFHEHNKMITSYLYSLTGNWAEAADLAQETFVVAYRKIDEFDPQRSVAVWLRAIAKNLARNAVRKAYRHREVLMDGDLMEEVYGALDQPSGHGKWEESLSALEGCLGKLPEKQRQVVDMHYGDDKAARYISETIGVLERSVFQLLWQARNNLKDCLRKAAVKMEALNQ